MSGIRYYYDPRLERDGDEYGISIYRILWGKSRRIMYVWDKDYNALLNEAGNLISILNSSRGLKNIFDAILLKLCIRSLQKHR